MVERSSSLPEIERGVIEFWERERIYEQTLEQNRRGKAFSFYDGPPFASGSPHFGHLLNSFVKDAVTRYWSMRGCQVERNFGWDCHGLPVEIYVEKKLGIKKKRDIVTLGIDKFNEACRTSVFDLIDEWLAMFRRIGRWGDYQHAYATMDDDYIESVWWSFAELWRKKLAFQEDRVMPYCLRCGTPLANFEVDLGGYHEVKAPSVFIQFKGSRNNEPVDFVAWTTTPWTLPANFGLAVNPDLTYVHVEVNGQNYIFAEHFLGRFRQLHPNAVVRERLTGQGLVGLRYEPLSVTVIDPTKVGQGSFQIYTAPFVAADEGTGIVHLAPYGADDFVLVKQHGINYAVPLDRDGIFSEQPAFLRGLDRQAANPKIIEALQTSGELLRAEEIAHQEPKCWRCDQDLIYYPIGSFLVKVTAIKDKLIRNNKAIDWVPDHMRDGRFGSWLEHARDWIVSRNRFWGAPIPVWQCPNGHQVVIGSRAELMKRGATVPADLHRPQIDAVMFRCDQCEQEMHRVEEVFDCWYESGSMSYAQYHYPFANQAKFKRSFPADFISEGLDQTRGWFYTLNVLSTALFGKPAFRHVIVNGLILDAQGRKLSKKLQNYPDPREVFDRYGADTLRYFLLSRTIPGEICRFDERSLTESQRELIFPFLNAVNFYETAMAMVAPPGQADHVLDHWLQTVTDGLATEVRAAMEAYDLRRALQAITRFVDDDLNNWYIKLSRDRLKLEEAPVVLGETLVTVCRLIAPLLPFVAEHSYKHLKLASPQPQSAFKASVFLDSQPAGRRSDVRLVEEMTKAREVVSLGWRIRKEQNLPLRLPLYYAWTNQPIASSLHLIVAETLNVKEVFADVSPKIKRSEVRVAEGAIEVALVTEVGDELRREQTVREFIRYVNDQRRQRGLTVRDRIALRLACADGDFRAALETNRQQLVAKTLASSLVIVAELPPAVTPISLGGVECTIEFDLIA